jgi:hypothetical protein
MPRVPLCPHGNLVEDCEWCSPSRIVQDAPPHILAELGAEQIGIGTIYKDGVAIGRVTSISLTPLKGPLGIDEPYSHI